MAKLNAISYFLILWIASGCIIISTGCMQSGQSLKLDFEDESVNELPKGWEENFTGEGSTSWKVVDDKGNKVMAQLEGNNPNKHFNVAAYKNFSAKNITLQVRFKAITGAHDQGGGLVWRYLDKNNYYIVRANPLENNVVLYKMENGIRTDLPLVDKGRTYGVDVDSLGNKWHELKVEVLDDLFTVFLDGTPIFKVNDHTFETAGLTGLWTKADAVTYFDNFEAKKND